MFLAAYPNVKCNLSTFISNEFHNFFRADFEMMIREKKKNIGKRRSYMLTSR